MLRQTFLLAAMLPFISSATLPFKYGYAHADCAPWDGAALSIVLQQTPPPRVPADQLPPPAYPQYRVTLWTRHPAVGQWLVIGRASSTVGNLGDGDASGHWHSRGGRVRITRLTGDRIEGELRIELPDASGHEQIFPFAAPILPYQAFCG